MRDGLIVIRQFHFTAGSIKAQRSMDAVLSLNMGRPAVVSSFSLVFANFFRVGVIDMTTSSEIDSLSGLQRAFFATGKSIEAEYRINALVRLREAVKKREEQIARALSEDLGKSTYESYMCEIGLVLDEISFHVKHLRKWARPKLVRPDLCNFPSVYYRVPEPYGVVLIMSPWNYPFLLTVEPLIGAISAGNCAVVKPSAYSPATSSVIKEIIEDVFDRGHVDCVLGGREENAALLDARWDYIFFTGSPNVGKLVMEKASQNLTPISLELGGKSPCVVSRDCNLRKAAQRVAFGKFLNVGQTCIAPDYVLCHEEVYEEFIKLLAKEVKRQYGRDALANQNYGKVVNQKHFDRLCGLIDQSKVVFGGRYDGSTLRIEPTIMRDVVSDDAVMGEEIFGPICPVVKVRDMDEAEAFIKARPKPLALYLFSNDEEVQDRFMRYVPFGGGCINDTIVHISSKRLPFGGVGNSGMGSYHGFESFKTFSHYKSVLKKANRFDVPIRMQPYTKAKMTVLKKFLH